jgi:thiamine transport system ATP-binding protein
VTHDVGEAFAIGDRVAVMRDGLIVQHGPPDQVWAQPRDEWVAGFLGMTNVRQQNGRRVVIRPEAVRVAPGDGAVVLTAQRRGAAVHLRVRLDEGETLEAVTTELDHPQPGQRVRVEIDPAGLAELTKNADDG